MRRALGAFVIVTALAACTAGGPFARDDPSSPFAPALDPGGESVDGLIVGNRLMASGQYDLALEAFTRAAGEQGLTGEVLMALGSANLALRRLNQAEPLLRRAIAAEPDWPEAWNNLGVVLIELGETSEAAEVFRRAFALDNGQSDSIRDNLRLALAKMEFSVYDDTLEQDYKIVRRGGGAFLVHRTGP
jgi:Flp pilus assembly protein TadD